MHRKKRVTAVINGVKTKNPRKQPRLEENYESKRISNFLNISVERVS